jgi:tetratricopeptide (TPR) repeat protein
MHLGNLSKAAEFAALSRSHFIEQGDERLLPHAVETEAQIAAARGKWDRSLQLATEAIELADKAGNQKAKVSGLLSAARAQSQLGDKKAAGRTFEQAATVARELNKPGLLKNVLGDWAEFLAEEGDHKAAYALTREALTS